jgi:hypothetical protein
MKSRDDILVRKSRLVERIANERERLAGNIDALQPLIGVADRGLAAVRALRAHPEWAAAAAMVFLVIRPRRTLVLLRRGFFVWRAARWARRALTRVLTGSEPRGFDQF